MKYRITLLTFLVLFSYSGFCQDWKKYPYTPEESLISFPKDEGRHTSEIAEWWYSTGQVTGNTTGNKYSYVVIYFYGPQAGFDGFRLLNIMNEDTGEKYFDSKPISYSKLSTENLDLEVTGLFIPKTEFFRNQLDNDNKIIPFKYDIFSATSNTELELKLNTTKRPLILGENGKFDQGSSSYTYYYSHTGIEVTGKIKFFDISEEVSGTGWIDRQYGDFDRNADERYEWFSAQLSNGMDLNFWNVFAADYSIPDNLKFKMMSSYVDENKQFFTKDFTLERIGYFCTPDGEKCYSKQWRVISEENNIDLLITSNKENSEVSLPVRFYEGATTISGTVNGVSVTGIGFTELLHTYDSPLLELSYPTEGIYNSTENISWKLDNPDDGNPLLYDVAYSIDDKQTFTNIAEGITDLFFKWENPTVNEGENIWFKITGYSVDKTIAGSVISSMSSSVTLSVETFEKNNLVLYPNPGKNTLKIDFPAMVNSVYYEISDLHGRLILKSEENNTNEVQIDIQNFKSGLYVLKLKNEKKVMHAKFLVE